MIKIQKSKLITCIIPRNHGRKLLQILRTEKNITTASMNTCRGTGTATPTSRDGIGQEQEKDIVVVQVPEKNADEIFDFIFDRAEIDRPHGGFMYMTKLSAGVDFVLPKNIAQEPQEV
ncbi:MAG: hypothetical protein CL678_15000 [Bdellovibrionaceae bacterium]|nr:hypothetical protein [Pseudobdellovibrionaceae bacterium]|tara:strand:+ start:290 stop:643 length:354 start_codon:yes stop_codon:yes gene_type:complete